MGVLETRTALASPETTSVGTGLKSHTADIGEAGKRSDSQWRRGGRPLLSNPLSPLLAAILLISQATITHGHFRDTRTNLQYHSLKTPSLKSQLPALNSSYLGFP